MNSRASIAGMSMSQLLSIAGFIIGCVTIWIHLEIRIAEINVDLANLKQEMIMHKAENRQDFESLRSDINRTSKEILVKVDEMEVYLRNRR